MSDKPRPSDSIVHPDSAPEREMRGHALEGLVGYLAQHPGSQDALMAWIIQANVHHLAAQMSAADPKGEATRVLVDVSSRMKDYLEANWRWYEPPAAVVYDAANLSVDDLVTLADGLKEPARTHSLRKLQGVMPVYLAYAQDALEPARQAYDRAANSFEVEANSLDRASLAIRSAGTLRHAPRLLKALRAKAEAEGPDAAIAWVKAVPAELETMPGAEQLSLAERLRLRLSAGLSVNAQRIAIARVWVEKRPDQIELLGEFARHAARLKEAGQIRREAEAKLRAVAKPAEQANAEKAVARVDALLEPAEPPKPRLRLNHKNRGPSP